MALLSTSAVGMAIAPSVKDFILTNANLNITKKDIKIDAGCDEVAQAISYAVAKALSSDVFLNSWIPVLVAGLATASAAGGVAFPIGATGFTAQASSYAALTASLTGAIKAVTTEL